MLFQCFVSPSLSHRHLVQSADLFFVITSSRQPLHVMFVCVWYVLGLLGFRPVSTGVRDRILMPTTCGTNVFVLQIEKLLNRTCNSPCFVTSCGLCASSVTSVTPRKGHYADRLGALQPHLVCQNLLVQSQRPQIRPTASPMIPQEPRIIATEPRTTSQEPPRTLARTSKNLSQHMSVCCATPNPAPSCD